MMLHTLSTPTFDPAGFIEIEALDEQTIGETRRRVSRVATLDGGVAVSDGGFAEGDRIIELAWRPSLAVREAAVARLVQLYPQAQIATPAGVFLCALESYTPGADESRLRALVISKLSA